MDTGELAEYLSTNQLGVLSWVSSAGAPQSAVVGLTFFSDTWEIVVGTSSTSRKHPAVLADPHVSIASYSGPTTTQAEGTARIIHAGDPDFEDCRKKVITLSPMKAKHADDVYIVISMEWARFTSVASTPWKTAEYTRHGDRLEQ